MARYLFRHPTFNEAMREMEARKRAIDRLKQPAIDRLAPILEAAYRRDGCPDRARIERCLFDGARLPPTDHPILLQPPGSPHGTWQLFEGGQIAIWVSAVDDGLHYPKIQAGPTWEDVCELPPYGNWQTNDPWRRFLDDRTTLREQHAGQWVLYHCDRTILGTSPSRDALVTLAAVQEPWFYWASGGNFIIRLI